MKNYDRIMIKILTNDLNIPSSFVTEFYCRYMDDWIEPDIDPKPDPIEPPEEYEDHDEEDD